MAESIQGVSSSERFQSEQPKLSMNFQNKIKIHNKQVHRYCLRLQIECRTSTQNKNKVK